MSILSYMPQGGGVKLPDMNNSGSASDLAAGKELIGQDGNVVVGTIEEIQSGFSYGGVAGPFEFSTGRPAPTVSAGAEFETFSPAVSFGDATAADVAAGKTFTSNAGLKVTGTGKIIQTVDLIVDGFLTSNELYAEVVGSDGEVSGLRITAAGTYSTIKNSLVFSPGRQISGANGSLQAIDSNSIYRITGSATILVGGGVT